MFLPQTVEYSLRAMAQMATLPGDAAVRTKDLAGKTKVPVHYLSKIMRHLVAEGLLESEKGRGGGFRFARPLKQISFADILKAVGFEVEPNRCAFGWGKCNSKQPCVLHAAVVELNANFRSWASRTTLYDIAKGDAAMP